MKAHTQFTWKMTTVVYSRNRLCSPPKLKQVTPIKSLCKSHIILPLHFVREIEVYNLQPLRYFSYPLLSSFFSIPSSSFASRKIPQFQFLQFTNFSIVQFTLWKLLFVAWLNLLPIDLSPHLHPFFHVTKKIAILLSSGFNPQLHRKMQHFPKRLFNITCLPRHTHTHFYPGSSHIYLLYEKEESKALFLHYKAEMASSVGYLGPSKADKVGKKH